MSFISASGCPLTRPKSYSLYLAPPRIESAAHPFHERIGKEQAEAVTEYCGRFRSEAGEGGEEPFDLSGRNCLTCAGSVRDGGFAYKEERCARPSAYSAHQAPETGPPLHAPSDSPGRLIQRNASTSALSV